MSQSITELENQLNLAIENCQFELAQNIKDQLEKQKQSQVDNDTSQILQAYKELIENCHENLLDEINNLNDSIFNQEMLIRQRASALFHELQVKHIEVLMEIEKNGMLKSIVEKYRFMPDVADTLEKAKLAAKNKKYEEAQVMKENAILAEQETLNQRQEAITQDFLTQREVIFKKQKDEIKNLTDQLREALFYLQKKKENELDIIYQRYQKLHRENLRNIIEMIKITINPKDNMKCITLCKKEYTTALNQYFKKNSTIASPKSSNSSEQSKSGKSSPRSQSSQNKKQNKSQSQISNKETGSTDSPTPSSKAAAKDDLNQTPVKKIKPLATPSPRSQKLKEPNQKPNLSKTPKKQ